MVRIRWPSACTLGVLLAALSALALPNASQGAPGARSAAGGPGGGGHGRVRRRWLLGRRSGVRARERRHRRRVRIRQRRAGDAYLARLAGTKRFARPVVTELAPLGTFRVAEAYHQDYLGRHPDDPYVVVNDAPKLVELRRRFPGLYRGREERVGAR